MSSTTQDAQQPTSSGTIHTTCRSAAAVAMVACLASLAAMLAPLSSTMAAERPNILVAISDDQSFPHAGAYGDEAATTPNFDRLAKQGVLFWQAYAGSPGCSPSRAVLLTGRHHWQLEHAGTHASAFSHRFQVFPELLEEAGYAVGYTGKGWGPGNFKAGGRERNPTGPSFSQLRLENRPTKGIRNTDYAANFADFLERKPADAPFCFWYGASEPHRVFEAGTGRRDGGKLATAKPPAFLPDLPEVREDLLDYYREVQHYDEHLGRMMDLLEERGELDNTLVIATSDNGMAFPRAKANCYDYGIHVPLAISWPQGIRGGRSVKDLVGFADLAPTILQAAGLEPLATMSGRSLMSLLAAEGEGVLEPDRRAFSGRERHSSSRYNNSAYPQRAMRTDRWLLIKNARPYRWPAGAPRKLNGDGTLGPPHGGYHDIDACPTLSLLIERQDDPAVAKYFHLAVDKRPTWELFDVSVDPACLNNLAIVADHAEVLERLQREFESYLRRTGDPRELDGGEVFETYRRYSPLRKFPAPNDEP